ncbi:MAG: hypothetical protein KDA37_16610, partial [Planctomycetales bacterium]|nr:hypothetical protein [Planctomycetales bacterium]
MPLVAQPSCPPGTTTREEAAQGELVALAPQRPEWTARNAALQQALAGTALDFWRQLGKSIAELSSRTPSKREVRASLEAFTQEHLPAARPSQQPTPRVIVGPNDRLAMTLTEENELPLPDAKEEQDLTPIETDEEIDLESDDFFLLLESEPAGFRPAALRALLRELEKFDASSEWAQEVIKEVDFLLGEDNQASVDFADATRRLTLLAQQGRRLADDHNGTRIAVLLRKASYAIDRRVETWRIAQRIVQHDAESLNQGDSPPRKASVVKPWRFASGRRDAWRRHLAMLLPSDAQAHGASEIDTEFTGVPSQAALASRALRQLGATNFRLAVMCLLSSYAEEPVVEPSDSLAIGSLLSDLEAYEVEPRPELAHRIAMRRIELKNSVKEDHAKLAAELNRNYRNANLRVAISQQLLTRQLPRLEPSSEPVSDRIAGTPVRGTAWTEKTLAISL